MPRQIHLNRGWMEDVRGDNTLDSNPQAPAPRQVMRGDFFRPILADISGRYGSDLRLGSEAGQP